MGGGMSRSCGGRVAGSGRWYRLVRGRRKGRGRGAEGVGVWQVDRGIGGGQCHALGVKREVLLEALITSAQQGSRRGVGAGGGGKEERGGGGDGVKDGGEEEINDIELASSASIRQHTLAYGGVQDGGEEEVKDVVRVLLLLYHPAVRGRREGGAGGGGDAGAHVDGSAKSGWIRRMLWLDSEVQAAGGDGGGGHARELKDHAQKKQEFVATASCACAAF